MRRRLRFVALLLVFMLASCGGGDSEATEVASSAVPEQPTADVTAVSSNAGTVEAIPAFTATGREVIAFATATLQPSVTPTLSPTPVIEVSPVEIAPDEPIVIGFAASFTGDAATVFGTTLQRGAELALVNRPTVTIDDVEFSIALDVQDDLCTATGGVQVANTFVGDESVVAVIGPMCDDACAGMIPVLDVARYTSISASCVASSLTQSDSYSFNRTIPSAQSEAQATADFLYNTVGARQIAVLYDDSPQGMDLADVVISEFEALSGEVVFQRIITRDDNRDAILALAAESEFDAIYYAGFADVGEGLISGRAEAGLDTVSFVSSALLFDTDLIARLGDAAEGLIVMRIVPPSGRPLDRFITQFTETYGEAPISTFAAHAYDATQIILDAIEAVGEIDDTGALVIDRDALNNYIRNLEGYAGLMGELACGGTGECAASVIEIYVVQAGEFVPLEDE